MKGRQAAFLRLSLQGDVYGVDDEATTDWTGDRSLTRELIYPMSVLSLGLATFLSRQHPVDKHGQHARGVNDTDRNGKARPLANSQEPGCMRGGAAAISVPAGSQ